MTECEELSIPDDTAEARRAHLEKLTKVKDAIIKVAPRTDATTKPLSGRWVDTMYDDGARKTRWATRGYEQMLDESEDFFSATPATIPLKTMLADAALKGHVAAIWYCSGTFCQSPLNTDGTESKVWIELLEKAELGQNYMWEAVSAFPGVKGVPKAWDTQRERSHEFRADGAVTSRRLLVLSFRTKSRTSRAESRKTHL